MEDSSHHITAARNFERNYLVAGDARGGEVRKFTRFNWFSFSCSTICMYIPFHLQIDETAFVYIPDFHICTSYQCLSSQMYNVNWRGVCSTTQALYSISIHPVSSIQPSTTLGIPMRDENSFPFRWNGMITTNRHLWFMLSDWSVCFARTWTREIKHRTTPNWVFVCFRYNPAPSPSQALAMCRLPGWHENSSMNLVIHISDFKRIVMLCSVCEWKRFTAIRNTWHWILSYENIDEYVHQLMAIMSRGWGYCIVVILKQLIKWHADDMLFGIYLSMAVFPLLKPGSLLLSLLKLSEESGGRCRTWSCWPDGGKWKTNCSVIIHKWMPPGVCWNVVRGSFSDST